MKKSKRILSLIIALTMIFSTFSFAFGEEGEASIDNEQENIILDKNEVKTGESIKVTIDIPEHKVAKNPWEWDYNILLRDKETGEDVLKEGENRAYSQIVKLRELYEDEEDVENQVVEVNFEIPNYVELGEYYLVVQDGMTDTTGMDWTEYQAEIKINTEDEQPIKQENIILDKNEVKTGESVNVTINIPEHKKADPSCPWELDYNIILRNKETGEDFPDKDSNKAYGQGVRLGESDIAEVDFKIPETIEPGEYYLVVQDTMTTYPDWTEYKEIITIKEELEEENKTMAKLSKTEVASGETVTVDVHIANYEKIESESCIHYDYEIYLNEENSSKTIKLGGVTSDNTDFEGNSSYEFTIPNELEVGSYIISINILRCDKQEIKLPIEVEEKSKESIVKIFTNFYGFAHMTDNEVTTEESVTFVASAKSDIDGSLEPIVTITNEMIDKGRIQKFNDEYKAWLVEGKNVIEIYAKDKNGNECRKTFNIIRKVYPKKLPIISVKGIKDYDIVSKGEVASIVIDAKDYSGKVLEPSIFIRNKAIIKGGEPVSIESTELGGKVEKQADGSYKITFFKDPKNIIGLNEIKEIVVEAIDEDGKKNSVIKEVIYNCSDTVVFAETRWIGMHNDPDKNIDWDIMVHLGTNFEKLKGSKYTLALQKKGGGYYRTPSGKQIVKEGRVGDDGKVVDILTIPKDTEPGEYWINFYFDEENTNANINFVVGQRCDTIPPEIKAHFRDLGHMESGEEREVHSNMLILKATAHDLTDGDIVPTVTVNGVEIERFEPKSYNRYRVELKEGKNTIVIEAMDEAKNKSKVEYTIISTKDTLNKIKLNKYRVNANDNLEVVFDMPKYANEEIDLLLYNTDIDYYHKAPREFYTDQGMPETYAFLPYVVKTKLDEDGQLNLNYEILQNVRSGYYMLETNIGGSTYRSPMFYVLGNEEDIIPPEIYLRGIEDGFVYNDSQVEFSVVANDMRDGKVEPLVKVNGEEVKAKTEGNYVANLVEGDNTIEVIAKDNSGNVATKQISIEYVKVDINDESVVETREALEKTSEYLKENATYSSDWKVVGIANAGKAVQKDYLEEVEKWAEGNKATSDKVTDYERIVLGVAAAGGDPRNIGGYNLIDKIYNYDEQGEIYFQGLNGVIYALIAMDTNRYFVPDTALYTREKLVDYILEKQNDDGGWDLYMEGNSDVDITSMTLISLAPYHDRADVVEAVEKASDWLSTVQRKEDGGYNSWGSENNSESVAQTIIALCANGVDPTEDKFTKNDNNLIDALLSFAQEDGTFLHVQPGAGEEGNTGMSTEQAYQALLAYDKFVKMGRKSKDGKASIYYFGEKLADAKGLIMGVDLDKDNKQAAKVNIENLGDKEQDMLLIIGVYDEENRMVDSVKVIDKIGVNENKTIYQEYKVPEGKNYTVKALLWDSLEGQNPLKAHPIMLKAN